MLAKRRKRINNERILQAHLSNVKLLIKKESWNAIRKYLKILSNEYNFKVAKYCLEHQYYNDLPFPETVEEAVAQAYGLKSLVNPNVQAEGIVWWNNEEELFEELDFRPNFKAINNKYLLK